MTHSSSTRQASPPRPGLLRPRRPGSHGKVTNIELFFDLVFVYAVTQLSHTLLHHLGLAGFAQVLFLFLAVWWVWIYTTWITNWLDPDRLQVRIALLVLMLAGLLLSTALPEAWGEHAWLFAGAYVFMQLGRTLYMLWALGDSSPVNTRNFQRIGIWLGTSAAFWIAGAWLEHARVALWIIALGLEYLGPALLFQVPGLSRSSTADWDIEGGHLAERCSLFVIIALGESVLVTGSSFAEAGLGAPAVLAFVSAFLGSVAMWWIYFDLGAERGSRTIRSSSDPGRQARVAYTYLHLLIIAGIVVCAVADELGLTEPDIAVDAIRAVATLGGPALYLLGNLLFKRATGAEHLPLSHLVGLALLAVCAIALRWWPVNMLSLGVATSVILIVVAAWETLSLKQLRNALGEQAGH
jgi:low temperature requirement protein LtrA